MCDIGKPVIIDIAGTIKELVKWALTEILWVIGIILFAFEVSLVAALQAFIFATLTAIYLGGAVAAEH